ncbi:MAG: hypothetical protein UW05_C0019G0003 [Candidatus Giovannonibacteria bacterium GW2011_GWC2_43_8]|nr:MAG: hypothetical protein UW05_C0019G0003 [Candidatus Giovannonibacteria bacterium GW2011_GWC2_43_8]
MPGSEKIDCFSVILQNPAAILQLYIGSKFEVIFTKALSLIDFSTTWYAV